MSNYAQVASEKLSQADFTNKKEQLRLQLVALADRQKSLLSCFAKQKEVTQGIQRRKEMSEMEQNLSDHLMEIELSSQNNPVDNPIVVSSDNPVLVANNIQLLSQNNNSVADNVETVDYDTQLLPNTMDDDELLIVTPQPQALTSSCTTTAASEGTIATDYSQPVGLDALISTEFLQPAKDCLSCTLMVRQ